MGYMAKESRYDTIQYNRCGASGLKLPMISLGFWHNFGDTGHYDNMKAMCRTAFDNGITHFDLANNYGPAYGSAERNLGQILRPPSQFRQPPPAKRTQSLKWSAL